MTLTFGKPSCVKTAQLRKLGGWVATQIVAYTLLISKIVFFVNRTISFTLGEVYEVDFVGTGSVTKVNKQWLSSHHSSIVSMGACYREIPGSNPGKGYNLITC